MQRVMIIGQPGSGKSTLARQIAEIARLPVFHIDQIHWQPGWVERAGPEKDRLCAQVHARPEWVFEGGRSSTWPDRLTRADTLIWLDFPLHVRAARVALRTLRYWGRTRPDLPDDCPERISPEFIRWIWNTRHSGRTMMQRFYTAAPANKTRHRMENARQVAGYLAALRMAANRGNLGIPHR